MSRREREDAAPSQAEAESDEREAICKQAYRRIVKASGRGVGVRLSALECWALESYDAAVRYAAFGEYGQFEED